MANDIFIIETIFIKKLLFDHKFLIQIFMGTLNLKNNYVQIFLLLIFQCCSEKDPDYILLYEFPPIVIINTDEAEIKQSTVYLKRNNDTIDVGSMIIYSKGEDKIDISFKFHKRDTLYKKDKVIFYLKGKKYIITDFLKRGVQSHGDPYIINYKINQYPFSDREGYIDPEKE